MNEFSTLAPNLFHIQTFKTDNLDEENTKQFTYSGSISDSNVF